MNSVMDIVTELLSESPEIRNDSQPIRKTRNQASKGFSQKSQDSQPKLVVIPKNESIKKLGYGCAGYGNRIYQAVKVWDISELPASSPWTHEHTPITHWKCKGCGAVFSIIGGTRGPVFIQ